MVLLSVFLTVSYGAQQGEKCNTAQQHHRPESKEDGCHLNLACIGSPECNTPEGTCLPLLDEGAPCKIFANSYFDQCKESLICTNPLGGAVGGNGVCSPVQTKSANTQTPAYKAEAILDEKIPD